MQDCVRLKGQNVPKGQAHRLYTEQNIWDALTFPSSTNHGTQCKNANKQELSLSLVKNVYWPSDLIGCSQDQKTIGVTCFCIVQKHYPEGRCLPVYCFPWKDGVCVGGGVEGSSMGCTQKWGLRSPLPEDVLWGAPTPLAPQLSCTVSSRALLFQWLLLEPTPMGGMQGVVEGSEATAKPAPLGGLRAQVVLPEEGQWTSRAEKILG